MSPKARVSPSQKSKTGPKTPKSPKAPTKKPAQSLLAWKTRWPASNDLAAWFECGVDKCKAIDDAATSVELAHLPIGGLADIGKKAQALKHVEFFSKRAKDSPIRDSVRLLLLGAEICLEADDLVGCEAYLQRTLAEEQRVTRKSEKGVPTEEVREFQVRYGLLDPNQARSAEEQAEVIFNRCERELQHATRAGDKKTAQALLKTMFECTPKVVAWRKERWLRVIIQQAAELKLNKFVQQVIASVPAKQRQELLRFDLFAELGMKPEAKAGAEAEIQDAWNELKSMTDPNIHFPIHRIIRALQCLIDIGDKKTAQNWFGKIAKSAKQWKCVIQGWTTTAVLTSFVPIVEQLEGKQAARELAASAHEHATAERDANFRKGAVAAALDASATADSLDAAIAEAYRLRSPTQRRMELAKLLARAGRWKELKSVCSEVASPKEAAEIAWSVKFELPGGAVS